MKNTILFNVVDDSAQQQNANRFKINPFRLLSTNFHVADTHDCVMYRGSLCAGTAVEQSRRNKCGTYEFW